MKIVVTGASGLIGTALVERLQRDGHDVHTLVRHAPRGDHEIRWDVEAGEIDADPLAGTDAVVHLAGAGIADKRWSPQRKHVIRDSRVDGTGLIARAIASLDPRPNVLLSMSAVGYYGDRNAEELTESSVPGAGFLAETCVAWEAAADAARDAGVRVVHPRLGVVLSKEGGALKKMLLPFKLGLGGRLGSGRQYFSWIGLDDVIEALVMFLTNPDFSGPVNLTSPNPVTNAEFTKALARALHRPALLPMPAFALRLALGREMAEEALLASVRAVPKRLEDADFTFKHPALNDALQAILK